ncbi:MAG TPA: alpha-N-acetylglucosaminidase [Verrucomicrobiae bacterium]|jgi:alpha-N-acetylglucosaminidase
MKFCRRPFLNRASRLLCSMLLLFLAGLAKTTPAALPSAAATVSVGSDLSTASAAHALIERVLPAQAARFICETIPAADDRDVFEIEAGQGKIVLRGNNGVSLAMAFNWYLRYVALTSYDWQATGPLTLTGELPIPGKKIRQVCAAKERFFLNYCTYGYTFPFLDFAGWQRFLDWLAMNGINRPLLQCGQEAVWLQVWQSYGLSETQVRDYFSGPAYLPWHRMSNLDHFDGPLPMSYITGQMELEKKLLAQARALGMKPVLSAFAGHVPEILKGLRPAARITQLHSGWGGFGPAKACWFLDPLDPLFAEIQARFLKAQTALYGTDHYYAADPFNEIDPPSWSPVFMASLGKGIYHSLAAVDADAVWYQMTWTFTGKWLKKSPDGKTPLQALCTAVPKGKMVLIDYVGEEHERYSTTDGFYDSTFLWDYIGNYGGNTYFRAPMASVAGKITRALSVPNCVGVSCAPEGIAGNPEIYEMILEQPWHDGSALNDQQWIASYADRRAGRHDPQVVKAWLIILDQVLNPGPQGHFDRGSAVTAKPPAWREAKAAPAPKTALAGEVRDRDPALLRGLVAGLDALFKAAPESQRADGYQYDAVNFTRQALAYYSDSVSARIKAAHQRNDSAELTRQTKIMLGILRDLDELTGTRHEFLLGPWIRDARAWGATPAEADYYEADARRIITEWGGGLSDYAHREWNGLLRDYYLPRWWHWAQAYAPEAVKGETPPGPSGRFASLKNAGYASTPVGDPLEVAKRLFQKYRLEMSRVGD